MEKILTNVLCNIRKRKTAAIALTILVFMLSLFLNIGAELLSQMQTLYDDRAAALSEADIVITEEYKNYKDSQLSYLESDRRVETAELVDAIYSDSMKIPYGENLINNMGYFVDITSDTKLCRAHLREEMDVSQDQALYIPYAMKSYGYLLGDKMQVTVCGEQYTYTIAGFTESVNMGIGNVGAFKMYLGHEAYLSLYQECGSKLLMAIKCKQAIDAEPVYDDFLKFVTSEATDQGEVCDGYSITHNLSKFAYSSMGFMAAVVFLGFACIVAVITAMVLRYRIIDNIEENMIAIGTLGALGYKEREIACIYGAEYIFTAVTGSLFGTICSYPITNFVGKMLADMTGLLWETSLCPLFNLILFVMILLLITLICIKTAGKIYKYPPIAALSKGVQSHDFKKNVIPLDKKTGNLQVQLAGKEALRSIKTNVMIAICIAGVTFATLLGFLLKQTFSADGKALLDMAGQELSNIEVSLSEQTDSEQFSKELLKMDGIRKVKPGAVTYVYINNMEIYTTVYDDFDGLETDKVFEGRFPRYDNEIVISGVLAEQLGVAIGDEIPVTQNGYTYKYVICGLSNAMNNMGKVAKLGKSGYQHINPYGKSNYLNVYVADGYSTEAVIGQIEEKYGTSSSDMAVNNEGTTAQDDKYEKIKAVADKKIAKLMNMYHVDSADYSIYIDGKIISGNTRKYVISNITNSYAGTESMLRTFILTFSNISAGILIVTLFIITLMLTLIVKTMVANGKVKYGILKALGYTSGQLMFQIAMSLMPSVLLGVGTGILVTFFTRNQLLGLGFKQIGVSKVFISMYPLSTIAVAAGLIGFAFMIAFFEARRVRKISAYELMVN